MNNLKKLFEHIVHSLKNEHAHGEPVPSIFKDCPLAWTPQTKKGRK
jgi:hypothetical protein